MHDLGSILERESLTVEPPGEFDRLVQRRDRKRRNHRVGAAVLALVLAVLAIGGLVRAFRGFGPRTPASHPSMAPAAACPPGSAPDQPGPVDQARPPALAGPMAFDRDSGRIVLLTGLRRDDRADRVWSFDVCTNTWQQMGPPPEGLSRDPTLAYDVESDRIFVIGTAGEIDGVRSVWAYDLDRDAWIPKGDAPTSTNVAAVDDPASGLIVRDSGASKMWTYDVGSDTWLEIEQLGAVPPRHVGNSDCAAQFLSYDASVDRLVLYLGHCGARASNATWEFDLRTRTWSEQPIATPDLSFGYHPWGRFAAYDEANGRTLVYSDGTIIAYDAAAHRWSVFGEPPQKMGYGPHTRLYSTVVYDPVNARLVLYGGITRMHSGLERRDDVWAFDLATGKWIQLLAPSGTRT